MKNLLFYVSLALSLFSCNTKSQSENTTSNEFEYYGEEINPEGAIAAEDFFDVFTEGDSIELKLRGTVQDVCTKKGCWMTLEIGEAEQLMVRFKDYGFFVPLNCDGRTAVIEGWAYKDGLTVEELKHYAFDAGKSEEEINAITEAEVSYTFMAKGVILE
ncbi:MAG: DUF4920 domain-containing protein [Chitinophagales bacterium]|nr:DUF4920 domain-containing protein [Chitinophagales bacterium]